MATLSITIELAWFQHGNENVPHQGPGLCLSQGYPLHSTGLPPTSTGVTLQYFIQEVLLDWMEAGNADPATIILWTKSPQKVRIFADLLNIVNFPSLRITLLNLEDLKCPPLAQICPTTQLWSITPKAVRLAGSSSKVWLKNLTSRLYLGLHEHFFFSIQYFVVALPSLVLDTLFFVPSFIVLSFDREVSI